MVFLHREAANKQLVVPKRGGGGGAKAKTRLFKGKISKSFREDAHKKKCLFSGRTTKVLPSQQ